MSSGSGTRSASSSCVSWSMPAMAISARATASRPAGLNLIVERMPATLELVAVAALLALAMGIPLGVLTALRRNTVDSQAVMTFSLAGVAMPTFVIGILLIYVFSVECKSWAPAAGLPGDWCFPSFGRGETVAVGWWTTGLLTASGLKAIVLPAAFLLAVPDDAGAAPGARSQMLESCAPTTSSSGPAASQPRRPFPATPSRTRCCRSSP